VWATTFVLGPSLIAWLDRGRLASNGPAPKRRTLMAGLSRLILTHPRTIVGIASLITVLTAWQLRRFGAGSLEYDFSHLRRRDTWVTGEGFWGKKMDTLMGRYHDLVPPDQAAKADEVEAIRRKMTPKVRARLTPDDDRHLDSLLGKERPAPIRDEEVPPALATGLRERDGSRGRVVLVFPNPATSWWRGETIAGFVDAMRDIARVPTGDGPSSCSPTRRRAGGAARPSPASSTPCGTSRASPRRRAAAPRAWRAARR
jgi:hypothetical protein